MTLVPLRLAYPAGSGGERSLTAVALVFAVMASTWTIRHAWAIYKLNRGVGDTVFYGADGQPWFRLDEQRHDVGDAGH